MLQAVFTKNVNKIEVSGLTQWDRGRELEVTIPDLPESFEAHFSYKGACTAYVVEATGTDGTSVIPIPNIILTQRKDAVCWIYYTDGDSGETVKTIYLPIEAREKPSDYVYTESEVLSYKSLEERIKALEKGGASDDAIAEAVQAWLEENPIPSGATEAQAKQIQENTTNINELQATVNDKVTNPTSGEVGQIIEIETVDENGKPTSYKAVDKPTGGGTTAEVTLPNNLVYYVADDEDGEGEETTGGSSVSVKQTLKSGVEIGSVTVDGNETKLYAPSSSGGSSGNEFTLLDTIDFSTLEDDYREYDITELLENGASEIVCVAKGIANASTSASSLGVNINDGAQFAFIVNGKSGNPMYSYGFMKVYKGIGVHIRYTSGNISGGTYSTNTGAMMDAYNLYPLTTNIMKLRIAKALTSTYYATEGTLEIYVR